VWIRERDSSWMTIEPLTDEWKTRVRPLLEMFVDRTPGSRIEEKEHSLVWHCRIVLAELAETRTVELKEALTGIANDMRLSITNGNKTIEVKAANTSKGRAAHRWMCRNDADFILAVGDDRTDEDMFSAAPEHAWTIRVGSESTIARHSVRSSADVLQLLDELAHTGLSPEMSNV